MSALGLNTKPEEEIEISVCVPIYNEEESVRLLYEAIVAALEPTGRSFEIVMVDDGSTDDTIPRLTAISAEDSRLVVIEFLRNEGQTAAMTAGIEHARGKYLATMDGDLQNDPADIPMMLDKLDEGFDIVVGWRVKRQDKFLTRKLPSMIANRIIGSITGLRIRDNGCSLKVYRGEIIKRVPLYSDMHRFIPAMTIPLGVRVEQVGVRHHARQYGESKYGLSRIFKVLLDLFAIKTLLLFALHPLRRFTGVASLSALAMVAFIFLINERPESTSVVQMATVSLFGSLSVFLVLLGLVVSTMFHNADLREMLDQEEEPPTGRSDPEQKTFMPNVYSLG